MSGKRSILFGILISFLVVSAVFGGGGKESVNAVKEPKVLRIADGIVDFALPGQSWGGDIPVTAALYDWLVEADEKGNLVPELAESWENTDGKKWTIKLRQGVKFHDGSDFNADDLIWCVERTQDPDLQHVSKWDFIVVERMEKIDDYTVKFYLTDSRPTFMYYFTGYNMIMLSSDYDYAGMGVTKPMGTGPFKAKEILVGEGAVLTKNENYWKSGYPKVDEIRYYFISDMETKMNMLEQGKADIVRDMAIGNLDRINKNPNLKYDIPYTYFRIVYMNVEKEPFNDPRVVEALKYCVDPEVLANVNMGKLGDNIFFSEFHIGVSQREYKKIAPRKRDIAKAKALLAEAGYADGVDLDIYYESDIDFSSAIALSLQEQAAPAGFRIKLKGNPRDIYLAQFWLNVGFGITAWSPRVDPSLILDLAYKTGGSWNESHLASPEADRIMNAILSELDEAKRIQLYGELQQWFHDKGPVMTIQVPFIVAQTKRVLEYNEPMTRIIKIEDIDLAQ